MLFLLNCIPWWSCCFLSRTENVFLTEEYLECLDGRLDTGGNNIRCEVQEAVPVLVPVA